MPYMSNQLVVRPGYSGVGDIFDDILSGAGKVLQVYSTQQQAQGAAAQAQRDIQAAMAAQQGPSTTTILMIGGVAVVAFLLLRKKRAD
jgi:hypothetical protein